MSITTRQGKMKDKEKLIDENKAATTDERLKDICVALNNLHTAAQYQSDKSDEILAKMNNLEQTVKSQGKKIDTHEYKIIELEKENLALKTNFFKVKLAMIDFEQTNRNMNIEISGIQERQGENLNALVSELADAMKLPYNENEVEAVYRLSKQKANNRRNIIIVRFSTKKVRDLWIQKKKTGLVSNNLIKGSNDDPIYINVNLQAAKKDLFWRARQAKKKLNYLYCWVDRNGNIYMKRKADSQIILIKTPEDIPDK